MRVKVIVPFEPTSTPPRVYESHLFSPPVAHIGPANICGVLRGCQLDSWSCRYGLCQAKNRERGRVTPVPPLHREFQPPLLKLVPVLPLICKRETKNETRHS